MTTPTLMLRQHQCAEELGQPLELGIAGEMPPGVQHGDQNGQAHRDRDEEEVVDARGRELDSREVQLVQSAPPWRAPPRSGAAGSELGLGPGITSASTIPPMQCNFGRFALLRAFHHGPCPEDRAGSEPGVYGCAPSATRTLVLRVAQRHPRRTGRPGTSSSWGERGAAAHGLPAAAVVDSADLPQHWAACRWLRRRPRPPAA